MYKNWKFSSIESIIGYLWIIDQLLHIIDYGNDAKMPKEKWSHKNLNFTPKH